MNNGFVKISRKFFTHELWNLNRTFSQGEAWLDFIQLARYDLEPHTENIGGRDITWCRGQLVASNRYLM
ncbi:MAG: hypothetical protein LUH22_05680, partial [Bacteroides sp.]|nr:hypothetical protein [Bacteroides sp.]